MSHTVQTEYFVSLLGAKTYPFALFAGNATQNQSSKDIFFAHKIYAKPGVSKAGLI